MPAKVPFTTEQDICKRYLLGETSGKIAQDHGVSISCIASVLKRNGIKPVGRKPKSQPKRLIAIDARAIVAAYSGGESENAIAKRFGVSRNVIRKRLVEAGAFIRDSPTANRLMMAFRTPEEHVRNTRAANAATRGKPQPEERLEKIAIGRQRSLKHVSIYDAAIADMLREKGFNVTLQKAVGRYNIDVAIEEHSIAVEVFGGCWHAHGRHAGRFRERLDYLLDRGWFPVIVWVSSCFPLKPGIVEYLGTLAEQLRRGEPVPRQEQVVRGDGKPCSIGKANLVYRAAIGGDKGGDLVRGEDGRFRREAPGV